MSVCDPVGGMHSMFRGVLPEQVFAPRPPGGLPARRRRSGRGSADAGAVAAHADELAGIIVEPVLQGAGGMHVYAPSACGVLREVADRHGRC